MFGNLAEMAGLMKKAKDLQGNLKNIKAELAEAEFTGEAGSGRVKVIVSGDMRIKKLEFMYGNGIIGKWVCSILISIGLIFILVLIRICYEDHKARGMRWKVMEVIEKDNKLKKDD